MLEETGLVNVYIEIEQFSNQKYEFNKESGKLELDRVLPHPFVYPYAYGFIPNTLADDSDDLDALIISNELLEKNKTYQAYIIGVLLMEDEKGKDEKIICVLENDFSKIKNIYDLDLSARNNIKWFFENYKKEEPGKWSKISGYDSKEKAIQLFTQSKTKYFSLNIKKSTAARTVVSDSIYGNLAYIDTNSNVCFLFTPKSGCSVTFQCYLDLLGLLNDGLIYDNFIHIYRTDVFNPNIPVINFDKLKKKKCKFIKIIMNPYIRAVSAYRNQTSHNLSFREYLKQLTTNKVDYFNGNDAYHYKCQYIKGEELFINKYIKINENETYNIPLKNGKVFNVNLNKYTSIHHGKKTERRVFCGDEPKNEINSNLPASYKYFYDDEIKKMVETYYKNDIEKYGFTFDFI
jgi:inorganic pyrophosphatase